MKRLAIISMASVLIAVPAFADNTGPSIDEMAKELGLDSTQTEAFSTILQEQRSSFRQRQQGLREGGVERGTDEARESNLAGRADTLERLGTVLSPEQIKQFEQIQGETLKGRHLRRHNRATEREARLQDRVANGEYEGQDSEEIAEKMEAVRDRTEMSSGVEDRRKRREDRRLRRSTEDSPQ